MKSNNLRIYNAQLPSKANDQCKSVSGGCILYVVFPELFHHRSHFSEYKILSYIRFMFFGNTKIIPLFAYTIK